jgi:hypothetical protein
VFLQPGKLMDSAEDKLNKRLRMGHFAYEKGVRVLGGQGMGGAYGGSLKDAITNAVAYVQNHQGETIILRFSHTGCHELVERALRQWIDAEESWGDSIYKQQGNIALQPLRVLRGKVIMIFDTGDHPNVTANSWQHGFHRYHRVDDDSEIHDGLGVCGVYQGTSDLRTVVENAEYGATYHSLHHLKDHLHFVYFQQTMFLKSVKKATLKTEGAGGAHTELPQYLASLGNGPYPHVISHDFVRQDTCTQIIQLNEEYR